MIAWVEDVAHATGIDKEFVHPVTGGHRVFERDGRVSPETLKSWEDAFHQVGADKLVHLGTGGERVVNPDGTFDADGMIKVATNLGELVADPQTTLLARATAMVFEEMVSAALDGLTRVNEDVGKTAKEIKGIKDKKEKIEGKIIGLKKLLDKIKDFAQNPKLNLKLLPDIAKGVYDELKDVGAF